MERTTPQSLGNGMCHWLRSDDDKAQVIQMVQEAFGVHVLQKRFDRYHAGMVPMLRSSPSVVAALSPTGTPALLLLTRAPHRPLGTSICVYIERRVTPGHFLPRIGLTRLSFDDALFDGTLIEGDLVRTSSGEHWLVASDLLGVHGQSLLRCRVPLAERLGRLQHLLASQHGPEPTDAFTVTVQHTFPLADLRAVLERVVPRLNYACRGVWFRAMHALHGKGSRGAAQDVLFTFQQAPPPACPVANDKAAAGGDGGVEAELADGEPEGRQDEGAPEIRPKPDDPCDHPQQGEHAVFHVRRTHLPDVYHLFDSAEAGQRGAHTGEALVACVPSLAASRWLRARFEGPGAAHSALPLPFRFESSFGKWVPAIPGDGI